MKKLILFLALICGILSANANDKGSKTNVPILSGRRMYKLTIQEKDTTAIKEFNRGLNVIKSNDNRSFLATMADNYKAAFCGQGISLSERIVDFGLKTIAEAVRNKRPDWEKAINNESQFVRVFPSQTEILDFYQDRSTIGPLDPSSLLFSGIGCKQIIESEETETTQKQSFEVFNLQCKIKTDSAGITRMLNHGKFEIEVDSFRFNPGICDLPNDSLSVHSDKRIGFSFDKRKDLKFNAEITISSSWMNQAMMVFTNVPIGKFNIIIDIDPTFLDNDGIFTYNKADDKDSEKAKLIHVNGDSFLVPRSYIGTTDMLNNVDSWGTGQYKIDIKLAETCKINESYYVKNNKWQRSKWRPEWKLIRRRKPSQFGKQILNVIGFGYSNGSWVTTLLDPMKTTIIQCENQWLNGANSQMQTSTRPSK